MKTRTGFVSNSSSSSFLLGLKKKPKNSHELEYILFPDNTTPPVWYDGETYAKEDISISVFNLLTDSMPISEIVEFISSGYFEGFPEYRQTTPQSDILSDDFYKKYGYRIFEEKEGQSKEEKKIIKKYNELHHEEYQNYLQTIKNAARTLWQKYKDQELEWYTVSYSDNDGAFNSYMEHAGIFDNVSHIRISHH